MNKRLLTFALEKITSRQRSTAIFVLRTNDVSADAKCLSTMKVVNT